MDIILVLKRCVQILKKLYTEYNSILELTWSLLLGFIFTKLFYPGLNELGFRITPTSLLPHTILLQPAIFSLIEC